jgi:hypothetical protein
MLQTTAASGVFVVEDDPVWFPDAKGCSNLRTLLFEKVRNSSSPFWYVYVHMHVCVVCMCLHEYVWVHGCLRKCMSECLCACICVGVYVWMHVCNVSGGLCVCVCVCVCVLVCVCV